MMMVVAITKKRDGDVALDDDDHNPQHPACPLFTFGGIEGNSLLAATDMEY